MSFKRITPFERIEFILSEPVNSSTLSCTFNISARLENIIDLLNGIELNYMDAGGLADPLLILNIKDVTLRLQGKEIQYLPGWFISQQFIAHRARMATPDLNDVNVPRLSFPLPYLFCGDQPSNSFPLFLTTRSNSELTIHITFFPSDNTTIESFQLLVVGYYLSTKELYAIKSRSTVFLYKTGITLPSISAEFKRHVSLDKSLSELDIAVTVADKIKSIPSLPWYYLFRHAQELNGTKLAEACIHSFHWTMLPVDNEDPGTGPDPIYTQLCHVDIRLGPQSLLPTTTTLFDLYGAPTPAAKLCSTIMPAMRHNSLRSVWQQSPQLIPPLHYPAGSINGNNNERFRNVCCYIFPRLPKHQGTTPECYLNMYQLTAVSGLTVSVETVFTIPYFNRDRYVRYIGIERLREPSRQFSFEFMALVYRTIDYDAVSNTFTVNDYGHE